MNMNEQMKKLREEIEQTLNEEKENLETYMEMAVPLRQSNLIGWIEALTYALGRIDAMPNADEPTVTVDDYHKRGDLYVTVRFPDGEQYVGLVEKWEGDEE